MPAAGQVAAHPGSKPGVTEGGTPETEHSCATLTSGVTELSIACGDSGSYRVWMVCTEEEAEKDGCSMFPAAAEGRRLGVVAWRWRVLKALRWSSMLYRTSYLELSIAPCYSSKWTTRYGTHHPGSTFLVIILIIKVRF